MNHIPVKWSCSTRICDIQCTKLIRTCSIRRVSTNSSSVYQTLVLKKRLSFCKKWGVHFSGDGSSMLCIFFFQSSGLATNFAIIETRRMWCSKFKSWIRNCVSFLKSNVDLLDYSNWYPNLRKWISRGFVLFVIYVKPYCKICSNNYCYCFRNLSICSNF